MHDSGQELLLKEEKEIFKAFLINNITSHSDNKEKKREREREKEGEGEEREREKLLALETGRGEGGREIGYIGGGRGTFLKDGIHSMCTYHVWCTYSMVYILLV